MSINIKLGFSQDFNRVKQVDFNRVNWKRIWPVVLKISKLNLATALKIKLMSTEEAGKNHIQYIWKRIWKLCEFFLGIFNCDKKKHVLFNPILPGGAQCTPCQFSFNNFFIYNPIAMKF